MTSGARCAGYVQRRDPSHLFYQHQYEKYEGQQTRTRHKEVRLHFLSYRLGVRAHRKPAPIVLPSDASQMAANGSKSAHKGGVTLLNSPRFRSFLFGNDLKTPAKIVLSILVGKLEMGLVNSFIQNTQRR